MNEGPLKGIKIIDASSVLMVPYCTKLLADMGAEIIKIETIDGDITRHIGPSVNKGMGAVFLNINRNKKSVCIDLKSPEGRLIIYKLIKISDVFVSNIRKVALKKIGSKARIELEKFFGKKIFIELHVKVSKNWRSNSNQLRKFGYKN